MPGWLSRRGLVVMAITVVVWGCNLPFMAGGGNGAATRVVQTISWMQTSLAENQTATAGVLPPSATPSPIPLPSPTLPPLPTASRPIVSTTALCWTGPGSAYPVVSSVQAGTQVEVLGVGSKVGWFVIKNPTYGDRCWIEAKALTLDPYFSTAGMEVFNPPPTPGPKVTPAPTPT
jgi:hypothetical protein